MSPYYSTYLDLLTRPRTGTSQSSSQTTGQKLEEDSTISTSHAPINTPNSGLKTTSIIAIVVGAVAGLLFLLVLFCLVRCCYKKRSKNLAKKRGRVQGRGWTKVEGREKLGDEDFGAMAYDDRDRLIRDQSPQPVRTAYEPYRGAGPSE